MKETFVAIAIVLCISLFCIFASSYTANTFAETQIHLDSCIKSVYSENWEKAEAELDSIRSSFNKHDAILRILSNHRELDEIERGILKTASAIELQNKDRCINELVSIAGIMRQIKDLEKITVANVL